MKTIAIENSTWVNLGDAFYQLSLQNIFSQAFPNARIVAMDGPVSRAFRVNRNRMVSAPFEADSHTDADHYVFSGPIIGPNFLSIYAPKIKKYLKAGKSYSLLSVRCGVSGEALRKVREFLQEYPPVAIYTRDPSSLEKLHSICSTERSGPCFAFFVNMLDGIPDIVPSEPFLSVSVYCSREPKITVDMIGGLSEASIHWASDPNTRLWRFQQHLEWISVFQTKHHIKGFDIVRPVQGLSGFPHKNFGKPNSYTSFNPLCYLGVIKSSAAVVSDRVHAGVAGLSFNRAVHIRPVDGRFDLFTDIPLETDGPFWRLDPSFIDKAYDDALNWVREIKLF